MEWIVPIGFACYLLYILIVNSWPACLWCALATATFLISRRRERPWARAAKSIAMPSAFGFGVVGVCLLLFNLFVQDTNVFGVASSTELFLLRLSHILPTWAKPALWQVVLVLIALAVLNRYVESVSLVGVFRRTLKLLGIGTAAVAAATSFSFFSSDGVLGQMTQGVETKVTVRYVSSQERIRDTLERYLLLRTRAEILNTLPTPQRQVVVDVHREVEKVERRSQAAATQIAKQIGANLLRRERSPSPGAEKSRTGPSEKPPHMLGLPAPPDALLSDPTATLAAQEQKEASARQLTSDAEQALEEAFNAAVGTGTKEVQTVAHALLDPLFEGMSLPFAPELATFVDKVSQEYIKQFVDPVVKRWATSIGSRIRPGGPGASPIGRPDATGLVRAIVEERLDAARRLANEAAAHIPHRLVTLHLRPLGADIRLDTPAPSPLRLDSPSVEPSAPQGEPEVANPEGHAVREWRVLSVPGPVRIDTLDDLDEQTYERARSQIAEATSLLETFGPVAVLVGIRAGLPREISQVITEDRAALAPYEPRFTALAQQRLERSIRQMEAIRDPFRDQLDHMDKRSLEERRGRIERDVMRPRPSGARR
jgi:hypothetical protein